MATEEQLAAFREAYETATAGGASYKDAFATASNAAEKSTTNKAQKLGGSQSSDLKDKGKGTNTGDGSSTYKAPEDEASAHAREMSDRTYGEFDSENGTALDKTLAWLGVKKTNDVKMSNDAVATGTSLQNEKNKLTVGEANAKENGANPETDAAIKQQRQIVRDLELSFRALREEDHNAYYSSLFNKIDFEAMSAKGNEIKTADNRVNFAIENSGHDAADIMPLSARKDENLVYINDDEKAVYNYLLGKGDTQGANAFLDYIQTSLNARAGQQKATDIENSGTGFMRTLREIDMGGAAGLEGSVEGLAQNLSSDARPVTASQFAMQGIQENIANRHEDNQKFNLEKLAVDAANTIAFMTPTLVGGMVNPLTGVTAMSLASRGKTYQELINQGYGKDEASAVATILGAAEGTTQYLIGGVSALGGKVSHNVIQKLVTNITSGFARSAAEVGLGMLAEISDEYLQNKIAPAVRNAILDENNEIKPFDEDDLYTVILTALTTGILEGPAVAINNTSSTALGKAITQNNATESLIQRGTQSNNAQTKALAEGMQNGKTVQSDINIGNLAKALNAEGVNLVTMRDRETEAEEQTAPTPGEQQATQNPEAREALVNILDGSINNNGRLNNTNADTILNNPELRAEAEQIIGRPLDGTKVENRQILQEYVRQRAYGKAQAQQFANYQTEQNRVEDAARQEAEAQAQEQARQNIQNTADSVQDVAQNGTDVAGAKRILNSPELRALYETITGTVLPESNNRAVDIIRRGGNNIVNSNALIDYVEQQMANQNAVQNNAEATTEQQQAPTGEQILLDAAGVPQNTQQNAPQNIVTEQNTPTNEITQPTPQNNSQTGNNELNNNPVVNENTDQQRTEPPAPDSFNLEDTEGNVRERGFSDTLRHDSNTEQVIRTEFDASPEYYNQLSNKSTLQKAEAMFAEGVNNALAKLNQAIGACKNQNAKLSPEMVPLSRMVANQLARDGRVDEARQILSDIAVELTAAGQLGQAARILNNTDPVTARATIQKAIDAVNAEYAKQHNDGWQYRLTPEDEALIDTIGEDGATFKDVYEEIAKRIGKQMPSTFLEKLTEERRIGMLLRPSTLSKNVWANVPMIGLRKGAESLSALIQKAIPEDQRTRGFATSEQRQMAKDYFKAHKNEILEQGNKFDFNTILRKNREIFHASKLDQKVAEMRGKDPKEAKAFGEALRTLTYNALERGDAPFVKSAFVDSLAQYCAAKNITDVEHITSEAIEFASANAMEATFKNANVVAKTINNLKQNCSPAVSTAIDIIIPFTTTPANILQLTTEYSPIGFAKLLTNKSIAEKIDVFSKATVGSAVMALGFALRAAGHITAGGDEDKDKAALDRATGVGNYSIGGRYSYDWAQPIGSLVALGAEIYDAASGKESVPDAIMNSIYVAGDSIASWSLFQGVMSILKGSGSPTQQIIDAIMEGGLTQVIPGIAGDVAKLMDGTVRSTYTGGNVFNDMIAKAQASSPWSKNLPASVNVKGEDNTRGDLATRAVDLTVNPFKRTFGERNAADEEIYRLEAETGSKTHFPHVAPYSLEYGQEKYKFNGEERAQYQRTSSEAYYGAVDYLMQNDTYMNLTADQQQSVLSELNEYATAMAKKEFLGSRDVDYTSDYDHIAELENPSEYIVTHHILRGFANGETRTKLIDDDFTAADRILDNYDSISPDTREMLQDKVKWLDEGLYAREVLGLGAEEYFSVVDSITEAQTNKDSALHGSTGGLADAVVISADYKNKSDEYKLKILRATNQPSDGKPSMIYRQVEYCMSRGYTFDESTKILATYKDEYDAREGEDNRSRDARTATRKLTNVDIVTLKAMESSTKMNDPKYVNVVDDGKRDFSTPREKPSYTGYLDGATALYDSAYGDTSGTSDDGADTIFEAVYGKKPNKKEPGGKKK